MMQDPNSPIMGLHLEGPYFSLQMAGAQIPEYIIPPRPEDYIPLIEGATIGSATGLYSLAIGFPVSLIFIIIVSLCTKAPAKEIADEFDAVKSVE